MSLTVRVKKVRVVVREHTTDTVSVCLDLPPVPMYPASEEVWFDCPCRSGSGVDYARRVFPGVDLEVI